VWACEESQDHLKPAVEIVLCTLPHLGANVGEGE
jgi:hypothetical protein